MNKKVIVFGADGFIGSRVCERLSSSSGIHVIRAGRMCDVTCEEALDNMLFEATKPATTPHNGGLLDAVIYAVGHCPAGGFLNAIKHPLSEFDASALDKEIDCHVHGVINVFQAFLGQMREGGHFIFMSSTATQLLTMSQEKRPPWLQIYAHLAAILAQNVLIEGMRMDPQVQACKINICEISSPMISDSPFYKCEGVPPMPVSVSSAEVVNSILECLTTTGHETKVLLPGPRQPVTA